MRSATSVIALAALLFPSRFALAQAAGFIEARAIICDAYAGRIDRGLENVRLYRELSQPDSLLVVRTETRMSRGQYGMQYVSGHAIVRRSADRRGVQASLLLYYRGEPRFPEPAHALRITIEDSVEIVPAGTTFRSQRHGEMLTLQIVAPLTTAQFMRIAQADEVEGRVGNESFRFTRSERMGLRAVHAAIMCGIDLVDARYASLNRSSADQLPPVGPRLGLDCYDAVGRPLLVAAEFEGAFSVAELDGPLKLLSAGPGRLPAELAGRPGRVELQFVVDTAGRVVPCTMTASHSSDTLFLQAAVDLVRWSRFAPGRKDGRKVRALVKQGGTFE